MGTYSDTLSLKVHLQWTHTLCEVDILEVYGWGSPFPLLKKTPNDIMKSIRFMWLNMLCHCRHVHKRIAIKRCNQSPRITCEINQYSSRNMLVRLTSSSRMRNSRSSFWSFASWISCLNRISSVSICFNWGEDVNMSKFWLWTWSYRQFSTWQWLKSET